MKIRSEDVLGITYPPGFGCPAINETKHTLRKMRLLLYLMKVRGNLSIHVYNVLYSGILECDSTLEFCRSQENDVRKWGG